MTEDTRLQEMATSDCKNKEEIKARGKKGKKNDRCIWKLQLLRAWPSEILSRFFKAGKNMSLL